MPDHDRPHTITGPGGEYRRGLTDDDASMYLIAGLLVIGTGLALLVVLVIGGAG